MLSPESTFYYTLQTSLQSNKVPGRVCGMGRRQEQRMDELPLCQAGDEGWLGSSSGALNPMCVHAQSRQLYLTLWDPMNCNPPGSSVHGILQARIVEWVAMPSSRGPSSSRSPALLQGTFEPACLTSPALAGRFFTTSTTWKPPPPPPKPHRSVVYHQG